MVYVILGMHNSGTTLLSQILHHSGINMVDNLNKDISYDKGNKYERESVLHLDMAILGARDYEIRALPRPKKLSMTNEQRDSMKAIIESCESNYKNWGFKDPRACFTYPLWDEELPEHRIIAIYRRPEEIWARYRWLGKVRRFYMNPYRACQFLRRWNEHNLAILEYLQNTNHKYLLLSHRELMTDNAEFSRLKGFIGSELTDQRKPELYRSRTEETNRLLGFADKFNEITTGVSFRSTMHRLETFRSRADRV